MSNYFFLNYKDCWFDEIKNYLNWLRNYFKKYDPLFILFYDQGVYSYHLKIFPEYKSNRFEYGGAVSKDKYFSVDLKNGIQVLKKYTYLKLLELNKEDDAISIYLDKEEADVVPHFFIWKNYLNVQDEENLNLILSSDKDLLQTTKFKNTYQILSAKRGARFITEILSNGNSIKYLIKKEIPEEIEKKEIFNSNWIPYFLSVGGDKSDGIPSVPKIGYKTFFNKLVKNKVFISQPNWEIIFKKIPELKKYEKIILRNFKLVDFDTISKSLEKYLSSKIGKLL
jgi:hypothetical protein